jgi:hypothetical protein
MSQTTADLLPGFYWVRIDNLEPEIARRDAEAGEWILLGAETGITDDHPADILVLGGPVAPPPRAG